MLRLLEKIGDLREGGDAGDEPLAEQAGDLVEHHELGWVGDGDGETAFRLLQRHEVVAEHHVHRHGLEEVVLDLEVFQVDKLGVVTTREGLGAIDLVEGEVSERKGERRGHGGKTLIGGSG